MPELADNAPETEAKHSRGLGSYVLWGFVVVMVYVLSSGPGFWLREHTKMNPQVFVVYRPLHWAFYNTLLHKPLLVYWRFWAPQYFERYGLK